MHTYIITSVHMPTSDRVPSNWDATLGKTRSKHVFGLGIYTLPETSSQSPENQWLEDDFPLGVPIIRGDWKRPCFAGLKPQNRGTVYIYIYKYIYIFYT